MKNRIRELRKALDLTQKAFAERIGMKSNTIATYEMGRATPSDPTVNNICKEFGVNERWLKSGVGEMFAPNASNALEALAAERKLTYGEMVIIEKFLNLKPEVRQEIIQCAIEVAAAVNADGIPADMPAFGSVAAAEAAYEKSLGFAPSMVSSPLSTTSDTGSKKKAAVND